MIFVYNWQTFQAISLKYYYFVYNSEMAIVYKPYRMRFFFIFLFFVGYICFPKQRLIKNKLNRQKKKLSCTW